MWSIIFLNIIKQFDKGICEEVEPILTITKIYLGDPLLSLVNHKYSIFAVH